MGLLWDSYGTLMGLLWDSYGTLMGLLWDSYGCTSSFFLIYRCLLVSSIVSLVSSIGVFSLLSKKKLVDTLKNSLL